MAKFGDTVRPELGRVSYGGFLAGAQQGAAALGAGLARAGQGMGDFMAQQREAKKEVAGTAKMMESFATLHEGSKLGQVASEFASQINNEEIPISQRHGMAQKAGTILSTMMHKQEQDIMGGRFAEQMGLNREEFGFRKEQAAQRAEMLRQEIGNEDDRQKGKMKALEMLMGSGDPASAGLLPPKGVKKQLDALGSDAARSSYLETMFAAQAKGGADYGTTSIDTVEIDPETGAEVPVKKTVMTIDGIPQMDQVIGKAPKGRAYASVEEDVSRQEAMMRSKSIQGEIDEINKASRDAQAKLPKMASAIQMLADGQVRTGTGATGVAALKRVGEALGIKTDVEDFEQLATILGDEVMSRIGETKGAVSDPEMALFQLYSASPSKTPAGNLRILRAKAKSLIRSQKEAQVIADLQKAGATNAQIKQQIEEYRNQDPVITQEDINAIMGGEPGSGAPSVSGETESQRRIRAFLLEDAP